jgi:tetratricopeptide (TPR) repeat protein
MRCSSRDVVEQVRTGRSEPIPAIGRYQLCHRDEGPGWRKTWFVLTQAYRLKDHARQLAARAGRPYQYFGERTRKEDLARQLALPAPASVYCRVWLVESLAQLGRFTEAAEHKAEMIRLAEATHHAFTVGLAYYASATLHLPEGDWGKARASIEHAIAVARAGNVAVLLPTAVASSAWVLAQLGEASEALNRLREGEQLLQRQAARGMYADRAWAYHALSRTCLLLGRLAEARSLCDRVVESSPCHPGFAAYAPHLLGDIATRSDRFGAESGETHYGQALALAAPRGMRPLVAHCHLGLGKLYRRTGKREQGREHLTTATTMYRGMDMQFWLGQAETEMSSHAPIAGQTDGS